MFKFTALAKNVFLSNIKEMQFPYRLTYILTYKCNLKCQMCTIWQKKADELSLAQIEKFFKASNKFSWINLSGGEIFLRDDFLDIIRVMYDECKSLYLLDFPTNGFLSKTIVSSVERIMRDFPIPKILVTVSLDGPKDVHDRLRGVPGSWERALETFQGLRKFRSRRFGVFLGMTLQEHNFDRFEDTFREVSGRIEDVRYDDFHFNLVQYSPHYYSNTDVTSQLDFQKLWVKLNAIAKSRAHNPLSPVSFLEKRYHALAKTYLDSKKTPLPCQALCASFYMAPNGDVYPCSIYDKRLGNIADFDYDIYKLWKSAFRKTLRKEIKEGRCPHCWTPCEAYQAILANLLPMPKRK